MPRLLSTFSLILLFGFSIFAQSHQNLPDLIEEVRPSVVSVVAYDSSGKRSSGGTGFVIGKNQIITNYHVVAGATRIEIRTSQRTIYKIISIKLGNKDADLAVLQTESENLAIRPLRITRTLPRVGEKIVVFGDPLGLSGTVTDGIVSAFRTLPKMGKLIQITAPISPGSSGSPVINMNGEVVGLATIYLEGGQNLNFAIASESLLNFWPQSEVAEKSSPRTSKSGRWRLLDTNTAYDTETLSRTATVVSSWIKYDNSDGSYTKVFTEVNCPNSLLRETRSLSYSAAGTYARENTIDTKWKSPVPESNGEEMYQIFCKEKPDYQSSVDYSRYSKLYRQGLDFQTNQKYDEAIATYSQMRTEVPDYAGWAFNAIAGLKLTQGKVREARNAVLEAIKLEPLDADTYSTLGDVYKEEKNYTGAIEAYWKSLRLPDEHPTRYGAISGLKEIFESRKDLVELTKLYIFANGKGETYFRELAEVYEQRKMPALAKATREKGVIHYQQEIQNRNGDPSLMDYWSLTELLDGIGDDNRLQRTLIAAMRLFPSDWLLADRLAKNYNKNRDWRKAIQVINEALPKMKKSLDKRLLLYTLRAAFLGLGSKEDVTKIDAQISQLP